jgi:hypothetical protein
MREAAVDSRGSGEEKSEPHFSHVTSDIQDASSSE